jgi:beta-glucosidase
MTRPLLAMLVLAASFGLRAFSAQQVSAPYQYPFQNPDQAIEERVNNVISLMTLDEKSAFLSSRPGIPRLGIRTMGHSEGLHGMAQGGPSNWGRRNPAPTTIFPQAYGMGETWDIELMRQAGALEGYEVRYLVQSETTKFPAPCIP